MRILIDALAARYGGTAAATVQLARHLAMRSKTLSVTVVTRQSSIVERGLAREKSVNCVSLPPTRHVELMHRIIWEGRGLPALVRREQVDALISMSGMLPRAPGCRLICLIGNPVMYEEGTPANLLRRWAVRRTVRNAGYLVAPSHHMADMVSASAGRPCAVLAWGVDHRLFFPAASPGEEILCVADFKAYKRHDLIIHAWRRLSPPRPPLRFVGNPDVERGAHAKLVRYVRALPEADSINMEYRVPYERMPDVYRRARLFVLPSEHESFCMPLAESMACGVPAVVRGMPSLRETGGTGAKYVDTDDPAEWALLMKRLIDDRDEHQQARELALRAAKRFDWDAFARDLIDYL